MGLRPAAEVVQEQLGCRPAVADAKQHAESLLDAALAMGAALGISPPAIAELLPEIEAVMVRRVNDQIAANRY